MATLEIEAAKVFRPLLDPSRYKGAWGGRGSGKSQFFADLMIGYALKIPGFRGLCCREIQKSLKESAKRLLEQKIIDHGLGHLFEVQTDGIKTPGGGLIAFAGLQDHTAESIKSYEGFDVAWVEEAQTVSPKSLNLLRPTIRKPGSELWFSWNPRRKADPVDEMLRGDELPTGALVVKANWADNPWFPAELEQERQDCLRMQPDQYDHIWDGGYVTIAEGAYYAKHLQAAKQEGRITELGIDPLFTVRGYCDLGGPGAKADAFALWVTQFKGGRINALHYYEAQGQEIGEHIAWLRTNGFGPGKIDIFLPHDGDSEAGPNRGNTWAQAFRDAGYSATTLRNEGSGISGARTTRIEVVRRRFPLVWFNDATTEAGRLALGWYHEKRHAELNVGLGPNHDWSSHCADAFGLMCADYQEPRTVRPINYSSKGIV